MTRVIRFLTMSCKTLRPVVFCGPSGSGKSTLVKKLMSEFPDKFGFSISHTTRKPRPGEIDGEHYHFTNKEDMSAALKDGKFIESACFSGNIYGTSKAAVEKVLKDEKVCILDIDTQGVKQIKQSGLHPWYIFIDPPSLEVLEQRLRQRSTEDEESLRNRLKVAAAEIEYGKTPGNFDIIILNDDLDRAYNELKTYLVNNIFTSES